MNSNSGNPRASSVSLSNYEFDFGLSTNRPRSMNDQKPCSSISPSSSTFSPQIMSKGAPSWQSNRASWIHQPGGLSTAPVSMVGDISGKSWNSVAPSSQSISIGIMKKNPNLFEDLVNSALGHDKSKSNVPLKNSAPLPTSSYHMRNLADSLPNSCGNKSSISTNSYTNYNYSAKGTPNLGGVSVKSTSKDPFSSLDVLGQMKPPSLNSRSNNGTQEDDVFGDFLNASNSTTNGDSYSGSHSNQASGIDPLDTLFSSSASKEPVTHEFFEPDDLGMPGEFGIGITEDGATDLEGLPAPPPGVSPLAALNRGMEYQKQGQYADAIKWLSWAVILLERMGNMSDFTEALSVRASCYKEVGEYKKAVADCTKVIEHDNENVPVLVQRALLYESMEKYNLGAEDLRTVMKLDPGNRVGRSTIHRLVKMAEG